MDDFARPEQAHARTCLAERLATAYRIRFEDDACDMAKVRLQRSLLAGDIRTTDLFMAVVSILCDVGGVFTRSREQKRLDAVASAWLEEIA